MSRWWGIVVGSGVALSPVHNQWLTNLATNSRGEVLFFLPAFGYLLWIMGTGLFLLHHWNRVKEVGWGDKRIAIPLLFIVGAIALSGITAGGWQAKFAPLGTGASLFGLYLMARVVGKDLFVPLAVGAAVASVGVVVSGVLQPGTITGGLVFEQNYDIVVGYVLLGASLLYGRWRLPLISLALTAMLLSGSPEGLFALGVAGIAVLVRRDWSRRLAVVLAPVVIIVIAGIVSGYGQTLYGYAGKIIAGETVSPYGEIGVPRDATAYRFQVIKDAMTHIKPLGEGYNLTDFSKNPVHNVPLVIVQQLGYPGILAGLAWLWVLIWCLVKTRWKYSWTLVLALSVFDHFIFTQLAPYFWMIAGVSMRTSGTSVIDSPATDLMFRPIDKSAKVR